MGANDDNTRAADDNDVDADATAIVSEVGDSDEVDDDKNDVNNQRGKKNHELIFLIIPSNSPKIHKIKREKI